MVRSAPEGMGGIEELVISGGTWHQRLCLLSSLATLSLIFPSNSVKSVKSGRNWDCTPLLRMRALIEKIDLGKTLSLMFPSDAVAEVS